MWTCQKYRDCRGGAIIPCGAGITAQAIDPFVRAGAIETSDYGRRLRWLEVESRGECYARCRLINQKEKICCRFAVFAQMSERQISLWLCSTGRSDGSRAFLSSNASIGERIYSAAPGVAICHV